MWRARSIYVDVAGDVWIARYSSMQVQLSSALTIFCSSEAPGLFFLRDDWENWMSWLPESMRRADSVFNSMRCDARDGIKRDAAEAKPSSCR